LGHSVQELLSRFYSTQTNNQEKHAIETTLQELQNTSFNWRISLSYMNTIENSYLWFFAATTVERTVNYLWNNLIPTDQQQLRTGLFDLYINYPCDVPALQRDKVAKIMATIARQQCTGNGKTYEEFVNSVLGLLENKFFLGLALVGAIGDTVTTTENVQTTLFGHIVNHHTPSIMEALNKYCGFFVVLVRGDNIQTVFDSINGERKNQYCSHLLNIIQQYFSWMELDRMQASLIGNISFLACSWHLMRDGAIGAVGALTELLYRNRSLPYDAGRQFAIGVNHIIGQETLKQSDELYQDKVCELIRQYIKRSCPYDYDNKEHLLNQLLEFTFFAKTPHALMDRINIWTYVCGSRYAEYTGSCLAGERIVPLFAHKLMGYLKQTLFFRTYPDLEVLDDEELDENFETELNRFQNQSIDLICQLLRFMEPPMVEETLVSLLQQNTSSPYVEGNIFFRGMLQSLQGNAQLLQGYDDERLTSVCMVDYMIGCNLIVELATLLYGKYPNIDFAMQQTTNGHIQLFLELSDVLDPIVEMFSKMVSFNAYIFPAFAQHILQIKLYLKMGPTGHGQGAEIVRKIHTTVPYEPKALLLVKLPRYILHQNNAKPADWARVVSAAVQLLNFYVSERLLGSKTCALVLDVLKGGVMSSKLMHLTKENRTMVQRAICMCLITLHDDPEPNPAEISPPVLLERYVCFVGSTVMEFVPASFQTLTAEQQKHIIDTLADELEQLASIMAACDVESSAVRSRLSTALLPVMQKTVTMFRSPLSIGTWAAKDPSGCRLFDGLLQFCNWTVITLQSRTDTQLLKEMVQLLKELFVAEEQFGVHRLRSVLALLNIFRQLSSDTYHRSLVPDIIHVVINEVLPVVANDERYTQQDELVRYEDVLNRLYDVLHDLLHHRWQYFVETSPQARVEPEARAIVQPEAFLAIMNAYGYALLHNSDYPTVVGTVLASLEMLNRRRRLFRLPLFIDQLLDNFLKSLLKLAMSHVGTMHLEQIGDVLYEMSYADQTRLKMIICDMGMTHDLTTYHMLQTA
uniref:Importin N-terminal domain-containing protein n=1 Tax=Anopheles maculatus TaxID=74869 RepID=A0A182SQ27_9DIPT